MSISKTSIYHYDLASADILVNHFICGQLQSSGGPFLPVDGEEGS